MQEKLLSHSGALREVNVFHQPEGWILEDGIILEGHYEHNMRIPFLSISPL